MAIRGARAKEEITQKILETFPESFLYNNNKEIRIPWIEDAENLQIKITLTCAKENVENAASEGSSVIDSVQTSNTATPAMTSPTDEEKESVKSLLERLGL